MGTPMRSQVGKLGKERVAVTTCGRRSLPLLLLALGGCGSGHDETVLLGPAQGDGVVDGVPPFLGLPPTADQSANSPALLSETAAFIDLERLEVAPGILPYSVQSPLWSDGAEKRRWMALPSDGRIGFAEHGAWAFPEGTVLIKHFGMVLDERAPDEVHRLETRFLVAARGGGYYGLVYAWDDDQRDARLLLDGAEEVLDIIASDGTVRQQRYTYPSQRACGACHSAATGQVIGVRTAQLNGEYQRSAGEAPTPGADGVNQLAAWAALDVFDAPLDGVPFAEREHLVSLDDEAQPLEARVRSYWDSNCSSCHNGSSAIPSWDARFSTPLERQGVLLAEPYAGPRSDGALLIVPGEPERSLIFLRSGSLRPGVGMPPLLHNRLDERYLERLGEWIESLPAR